jgi:hypothetical protein
MTEKPENTMLDGGINSGYKIQLSLCISKRHNVHKMQNSSSWNGMGAHCAAYFC